MTQTDKLLAVLDMPENEQWSFLCSHQRIQEICSNQIDAHCQKKYKRMVLADLAFRLRDEVCKDSITCDNYIKALRWVHKCFCISQEGTILQNMILYDHWLAIFIVPIERIVAALIAKENQK